MFSDALPTASLPNIFTMLKVGGFSQSPGCKANPEQEDHIHCLGSLAGRIFKTLRIHSRPHRARTAEVSEMEVAI